MDAMLKILAPDVIWYQDFIFSTILKLPGVVDVRSIVTLAESKSTTAIPMRRASSADHEHRRISHAQLSGRPR